MAKEIRIDYGKGGLPVVTENELVCATYVEKRTGEYYYLLFNKDGNLYNPQADTITTVSKRMMKIKKVNSEAFCLYLKFLGNSSSSVYQSANRKAIS